jgi:LPPG:FO 2-phospho-L-lactate transferase
MKIVALAGGVGGAKLVDGLAKVLHPKDLTVIVNTGDDFHHWGLKICPDLDTVCYTVAGFANPETGWGRRDESWKVLSEISQLKGEDWFKIGDRDLATHIERTERIASGKRLSEVTRSFCQSWGIAISVLPMTDEPVATIVKTQEQGDLAFQEYFVHQHCEPTVKGFKFTGVEFSRPSPGVLESIAEADAVIFSPSNPWVSLDPILSVPGIAPAVKKTKIVAAVTPIIAGATIKGPAAKMFLELGIEPSAFAVAQHYEGMITHFILDELDRDLDTEIAGLGISTLCTNTVMKSTDDRHKLAADVLNFIQSTA